VHIHVKKRDDRTVRVDVATFLKEILDGLGGVQYDDNLAKNTKREHIPYHPFCKQGTLDNK